MADVINDVAGLISPLKRQNPGLFRALQLLNGQLSRVTRDLEPLIVESTGASTGGGVGPDTPNLTYTFTSTTVRFIWTQVDGAAFYEMRLGTDWDTASFLFRSVNTQADIDALAAGSYTFLLKSLDLDNNYSTDPYTLTINVPTILSVPLTGQVIDNNVLLTWSAPTSVFAIDYYEVFRDGVSLGTTQGTFVTRFEVASGTYLYSVIAHDIAGNESAESQLSLIVKQPPDYELQATFDSSLTGTTVNTIVESQPTPKKLVGPTDTSRTWAQHFTDHVWTTIQDQINAGYPIYAQPSATGGSPDGSYEERVDFGVEFASTIVTVIYNYNQVYAGHDVNVVIKMKWSADDITYTAYTSGASQFATSLRYLKFKIELTSADNKALIEMFNISVNLQVKREDDGGEVDALSTDVGGTSVTFNKAFKDIDKITVSVKDTTMYVATVDFIDVPDPTGFTVYVWDQTGARASKRVEWHARGVL